MENEKMRIEVYRTNYGDPTFFRVEFKSSCGSPRMVECGAWLDPEQFLELRAKLLAVALNDQKKEDAKSE